MDWTRMLGIVILGIPCAYIVCVVFGGRNVRNETEDRKPRQ
jgi:hypothetical protein